MHVEQIDYRTAIEFLMPRHYSGRKPNISKAFGWFFGSRLMAVCTFGKPASPFLCKGIMGEEFKNSVFELNRLCREEDLKEPLSKFVGECLRILSDENWIVVSYADSGMNHAGYIYQSCNFLYTGMTKERTDKFTSGNKHSRHYSNEEQDGRRKVRTAKHRYVYFCTKNRKLKRFWKENLKYGIEDYPKTENKNYILGTYMEPKIIS